jgi:hypothetical protein
MLNPTATHNRRTRWVLTGLEAGALLFLAGLAVLYLNPFWHFDEGGFLDHRVHWWNAAGEILIGTGLLTEVLALVAGAALLVSGFAGQRDWPYLVAALIVFCGVLWISYAGFTRNVDANFEWNAADGFTAFRLQFMEEDGAAGPIAGGALWQSTVEAQIQPMLRSYFRLNDWQKMNGEIGIKVVRLLPIAWPIDLGSGGETLKDPDETELMRAASQEDLKTVQQLLSASANANVNALDQTGQTALILACENSKASPAVVKALLAAGADLNLRSRNGYTALTWALARNNGEVIRLLRRAGGRP